ncbi:PLP-dependent aminotransferase family protein [Chelativorans alearense]|uniref:MocR-like pyridoxine biosynthesis transcription factor PdxR n=1 Tax=Chelativorans alearense TaxID=2681495 RepID=UPI0013D62E84|nr:PLP-dependent aminotransferase family protein [Chelativorans alearense]
MANFQKYEQANLQAALFALTLERGAAHPLHVQLAGALRALILSGRAAPGMRLPPSRQLAQELSVSRATAQSALDQLIAEGYLQGRRGAGTFVAEDLPHLAPPSASPTAGPAPQGPREARPFHPGVPEMHAFPHAAWARHLEAAWRNPHPDLLKLPDPFGWVPLRAAIAAHLGAWRNLRCSAGQVVITSSAAETFGLIAHLFRPGQAVHVEDPCYGPMRDRLEAAGLVCMPVRVDSDGFDPDLLACEAVCAVVTPSRQYPLGMTLPVARRLALLEWAGRNEALVIEDDYDSEFRFTGQPLPALASLDGGGRTIYVGSFSKLLSPALRLSYMVVPPALIARLRGAIGSAGTQASLIPQPALARLMESGEFATHLRRMRRLYAGRQRALLDAIASDLQGWLVPYAEPSGMHILCDSGPRLAGRLDSEVAVGAHRAGLTLRPLSGYPQAAPRRQGFVLGYAAFDEPTLRAGVRRLRRVLEAFGFAK